MNIAQSPMQKREDFPIATFRFLEGNLQILRKKIMEKAAEIAYQESPSEEKVFVVEKKHVEMVIEGMGLTHFLS